MSTLVFWKGYQAAIDDAEAAYRAGKMPAWFRKTRRKFNLPSPRTPLETAARNVLDIVTDDARKGRERIEIGSPVWDEAIDQLRTALDQ
jgi:hypothetical protein